MSFSTGPGDARGREASEVPPAGAEPPADPNRRDVQQETPNIERGSAADDRAATGPAKNMLPGRLRRALGLERLVMRLVATCGIVGIGVALGAILVSSNVQGWITGLVVSLVSVVLAAILWSSRQL